MPKVEIHDPLEGTSQASARLYRQRHSRRDRIPGDTEMTFRKLILTAAIATAPALLARSGADARQPASNQGGLDPATIGKPLADSWPTYSGDYTGRRYSTLTQINQTTVKNLTLAWVGRVSGPPWSGGSRRRVRRIRRRPRRVAAARAADHRRRRSGRCRRPAAASRSRGPCCR